MRSRWPARAPRRAGRRALGRRRDRGRALVRLERALGAARRARFARSHQIGCDHDGRLVHPGVLGAELSVEEGTEAARWCALNALSVLRAGLGSLDRIRSDAITMAGSCTPACWAPSSRSKKGPRPRAGAP